MRGTDKGYIECSNEDNYVTSFFIVGRNIEIVPQNHFFHVPIVEGNGLQFGHLRNISSDPNQHTLLRISIQRTQAEDEESGRVEGWRGVVGEVG